jgi:hypothetical protein
LGRGILQFEFPAITLPGLDAGTYLAQPQALAGALAARMRPAANTPRSRHKLACLRRIIDGSGVEAEQTRQLQEDVLRVLEARLGPVPATVAPPRAPNRY